MAYARCTVTMQFSFLPRVPHHCRCTPGVLSPCFTSLVSSMMPTEFGPDVLADRPSPGGGSARDPRPTCRHARNSCKSRGGTPAATAIGSQLFSAKSDNCPSTYVEKCSRDSSREKQSSNRFR